MCTEQVINNIFFQPFFNAMIDVKAFFDQPLKNDIRTYDKIPNIATGSGDDYVTGCLLDYVHYKNYYKFK